MNSILIYINVFAIILYIKAKDEGRSVSETIINLNSQRKNSKKTQAITGITIYFTIALLVFLKYLCKNIMLTEQGKEEKNKLLSLKKYIIDYSLIKNRELESVVIWDEYLAYAVAFSIPNKITEQIYEKWYDLNLKLQVFENILKI